MKRRIIKCLPSLVGFLAATAPAQDTPGDHWPSFRGSHASGLGRPPAPPIHWDAAQGENLAWKTPIPGLGHSSPVLWEDRVFVTTAVPAREETALKVGLYGDIASVQEGQAYAWLVFCLNKQTGQVVWQARAHEGVPRFKRHPKSTHANPTPTTDGRHVVAFFGAEGLYCYDFAGRLLWQRDLGALNAGFYRVPSAEWGFGSSPVIHGHLVLVQCDVQENSFLAALRVETGEELWRVPRQDVPTWSTPTALETGGRRQVIVNGYKQMGGYDLTTGRELWKLRGGGDIPVPTPVVARNLIFLTSAHGRVAPIYAVRTDAVGDITLEPGTTTNRFVAWSLPRRGNYMQTPIVVGEYLYCCSDAGILACYEAQSGRNLYRERLGEGRSGFTASPVASGKLIYLTSETGEVYVVEAGPAFKLLATNPLSETCLSTPAISQGWLFFRTRHHLLAVASD